MKMAVSRKLLAPALLAIAIAPLALSATAAHHGKGAEQSQEQREQWKEARAEYRAEQRQALFERAGIDEATREALDEARTCLLYTSPSPRDRTRSRMPSSA